MKHFDLMPVQQNLKCQKNWDFQFEVLDFIFFFFRKFKKRKKNLNLAVEEISQLIIFRLPFCIFFSKNRKNDRNYIFFYLNLIFFLARTLCKDLESIGIVFLSQFGCSDFSSIPTEIQEKTLTKQKIKKMTHSQEQGFKYHFIS